MAWFMGIDIGSSSSEGIITENGQVKAQIRLPSGANYQKTAESLRNELLSQLGLSPADITATVATGQGAGNVPYPNRQVNDIQCCARGINRLLPSVRTVIDIQAQSSQVIRLSESGQVINFTTTEKCAAGSGYFLDIIANVLQIDLDKIGPLSLRSQNPVTFTTSCAVFGESEAISRVAEGIPPEDILAGVHQALSNKISAMVDRVGMETDVAVSGGGALDTGLVKSLENKLGIPLLVPENPQMVTALGAAIMAGETASKANN